MGNTVPAIKKMDSTVYYCPYPIDLPSPLQEIRKESSHTVENDPKRKMDPDCIYITGKERLDEKDQTGWAQSTIPPIKAEDPNGLILQEAEKPDSAANEKVILAAQTLDNQRNISGME